MLADDIRAHLHGVASVDDAARIVADEVAALGWGTCTVYVISAGRLRCHAARGYWHVGDGFRLDNGTMAATIQANQPMVFDHHDTGDGTRTELATRRHELCVPILVAAEPVGVIDVESDLPFPHEVVAQLTVAGEVLGTAIHALGGVPQENGWRRLAGCAPEFAAMDSEAEVWASTVALATALTNMHTAVVLGDADGQPTILAAEGPLAHAIASVHDDTLRAVLAWGRDTRTTRTIGEQRGAGFPGHGPLRDLGLQHLIATTLGTDARASEMLVVADDETRPVDPDTVGQLEVLASIAASAAATQRSIADLRALADLDALTGLRHRRLFRSRIDRWAADDTAGAVLVFDIDRFATVNETFGHEAGDQLLIAVARAISSEMRADDALYRVGGDEFVALIDDVDLELATQIAERSREATKRTGASISIGVATVGDGRSLADAYAAADRALAAAKQAGRDAVVTI